jgi:hypothetical protein
MGGHLAHSDVNDVEDDEGFYVHVNAARLEVPRSYLFGKAGVY